MTTHTLSKYDIQRLERALAEPQQLWVRALNGREPQFRPRHANQWAKHSRRAVTRMAGRQAKPSYRQRQASARAAKNRARIQVA